MKYDCSLKRGGNRVEFSSLPPPPHDFIKSGYFNRTGLLFLYLSFICLFFPLNAFAKARCPAQMSMEECCSGDPRGYNMTLSECSNRCSGTCSDSGAYYAGCAQCTYSSASCPSNCSSCFNGKCSSCNAGYYHYTYESADMCIPTDFVLPDGSKVTHPGNSNYCSAVGMSWAGSGANSNRATVACKDLYCTGSGTLNGGSMLYTCKQCSTGHYLSNNRCPACSSAMPGCSTCSSASSCSACSSGYYLSGSTCVSCSGIPNCTACSGKSTCTACAGGYTLTGGKCVMTNTVSSCPPDMTKSSDGCCCVKA